MWLSSVERTDITHKTCSLGIVYGPVSWRVVRGVGPLFLRQPPWSSDFRLLWRGLTSARNFKNTTKHHFQTYSQCRGEHIPYTPRHSPPHHPQPLSNYGASDYADLMLFVTIRALWDCDKLWWNCQIETKETNGDAKLALDRFSPSNIFRNSFVVRCLYGI